MPEFIVKFILPDNSVKQISVNQTEDILDAALNAGIELPYRCLQGWCLSCAVKIVSGEIDQNDSKRFFKEDREDHFALICTGKARSNLVLKTHAKAEMKASRKKNHLPYPKGSWGD
ncbi:MAG: 2Fe-2S iron-sulfur cluster-binding protein [Clostridiales bacterium]